MARQKRSKEAPSAPREVEWGGFVDIRLDDDEKAAFRVWQEDHKDELWLNFVEVVSAGFKFGLSYDAQGDFYHATLTGSGVELMGLQNRYCLTARSPLWFEAVALALFKHLEIAHGDWGAYKPRTRRMDNFG